MNSGDENSGAAAPAAPVTAVFGISGFIGGRVFDQLRWENPATVGISKGSGGGLTGFDLARPEIGSLDLAGRGVTHAIIAAAVSGVAACERDPSRTRQINVAGTAELARQLTGQGIRVVAFSSDYVFDGRAGGYDESSALNPLNEYGRQKAELEQLLTKDSGRDILVIRLGKVFDTVWGSGTLLDDIAGKLLQGEPVRAASDQYFCPTAIDDLVAIVKELLAADLTGIINVCAPEVTSRLQLAFRVAEGFACNPELVKGIWLRDLDEGFVRPLDTSMVCSRLAAAGKARFRSLDAGLGALKKSYAETPVALRD